MDDTAETTTETGGEVISLDAKREAKNAKRREQRAAAKAKKAAPPPPAMPKKKEDAHVELGKFEPVEWKLRKNTKRFKVFDLLNCEDGATLAKGAKATGWSENVVLSEIHEIAKILHVRVVRDGTFYHLRHK